MTTITHEMSPLYTVYTVRSTDLSRPLVFPTLTKAIAFCRHVGLPYSVA